MNFVVFEGLFWEKQINIIFVYRNLFKVDDESKENSLDLKMAFSINIVLGIFQP